jgi:hypothetical protein
MQSGAKLEGGMGGAGCDTPQNTNHLDWQGDSSGLAGRFIWIGRAIKDFK